MIMLIFIQKENTKNTHECVQKIATTQKKKIKVKATNTVKEIYRNYQVIKVKVE